MQNNTEFTTIWFGNPYQKYLDNILDILNVHTIFLMQENIWKDLGI